MARRYLALVLAGLLGSCFSSDARAQCEACSPGVPCLRAPVPGMPGSVIPEVIVMGPSPRFSGNPISQYVVNVQDCLGPMAGILIQVEFSPETLELVSWCGSPPPPVSTAVTDVSGDASFEFFGGGCVREGDLHSPTPWVAEVRAVVDGISYVLSHPTITSADVVDASGVIPSVSGVPVCDPAAGMTQVGIADAVAHTAAITLGLHEVCSKVTWPFDDAVGVLDAVFLSQYLAAGSSCSCQ